MIDQIQMLIDTAAKEIIPINLRCDNYFIKAAIVIEAFFN